MNTSETKMQGATAVALHAVVRRRFVELFGEIGDQVYEKEWNALFDIWREAWKQSRRLALLDASTEVASHWNDTATVIRQYEQSQRSAGVLQRMALGEPTRTRDPRPGEIDAHFQAMHDEIKRAASPPNTVLGREGAKPK